MPRHKVKKTEEEVIEIVGEAYEGLKSQIKKYAADEVPVLLVGETGTGKELFARYYMASCPRNKKNCLSVNCAGFSDELLASEIFGHEIGSFTGAIKNRAGKLRACEGGILFLDELGDASPKFQAAILRVVEYSTFYPVGSDIELKSDTLIIGATNKPEGLRGDLKYRFHVLHVPPLQKCDIPILAYHFLGRPLKNEILEDLIDRRFPGNVRELKKLCEKIKTEKGDSIFNHNKTYLTINSSFFDYDRYLQELETWNKHILPILRILKIKGPKYVYMDWDEEWGNSNCENNRIDLCNSLPDGQNNTPGFPRNGRELLEWIYLKSHKYDCENIELDEYSELSKNLKLFKEYVDQSLEKGTMPYLLKKIREMNITKKKEQVINKPCLSHLLDMRMKGASNGFLNAYLEYEKVKNKKNTGLKKKNKRVMKDRGIKIPLLSHLLEIPKKEAYKGFLKAYFEYHYLNNEKDLDKLAKSLRMKKKSLKQKISRLGE
jgi:hypothetical protein